MFKRGYDVPFSWYQDEAFCTSAPPWVKRDRWTVPEFASEPLTPRWMLQWFGTDLCRTLLDDKIWIRATLLAIQRSRVPRVVITDMRFPNEAELLPAYLRDCDSDAHSKFRTFRLRIEDPHAPPLDPATAHASERFIDDLPVEAVLVNDKTLGFAALERVVRATLAASQLPFDDADSDSTLACAAAAEARQAETTLSAAVADTTTGAVAVAEPARTQHSNKQRQRPLDHLKFGSA